MKQGSLSRRSFIKGVSCTAFGVGFVVAMPVSRATTPWQSPTVGSPTELLSWVIIHPDNTTTIHVPQTELGQGASTTIPQVLADELDLDWSLVKFEFYDPSVNASQANPFAWTTTVSSSSAHYLFTPIRTAAAQIRTMLVNAAAVRLNVSVGELEPSRSFIKHGASGRMLAYAELAADASKLGAPQPDQVTLKSATNQTLIGKPLERLDLVSITQGTKQFGIDVDLSGMRFAAIRQSPIYGASLHRFDAASIADMPGSPHVFALKRALVGYNSPVPEGADPDLWAATVKIDDSVAIVADSWWQAKSALEALPIHWSESPHQTFSSVALTELLVEKVQNALPIVAETGDFDAALKTAAQTLDAVYVYPFMDPAPLEPMNCTALVDGGEVHVWTNSQYPDDAWRIAYELGEVAPAQAHLHLMPAGGGFGRRLHNDFVYQAMQIAKQNSGTPVKLLWTREETTKHSYYAPLTVARFDGGLDAKGNVSAWRCRVASGFSAEQSYGAVRIPFRPPNTRFEYQRDQNTPVPFGWMRGVGFTQHHWMNFSFLDEMRIASGKDAISFYRELLDSEQIPIDTTNYAINVERMKRNLRLLDYAINVGPWHAPKEAGVGRGLCVSDSDYFAGYTTSTKAAIVDVAIGKDGKPVVESVFIAIDAGIAINPDIVRAQLEGGVAYALTTALMSEITVENGQVQQSNFHDYPMLTMTQMPRIDVVILPSDEPPRGVGEDAVPVTIAALVNAIVDAGGPRIRRLPINSHV
ncbi:MAG: isoquinoline 1-oxidoreductase beta subunit [Gammaproteobacteria bacterium]|jgi:isoquinoline 1-oxidoreductase beta subunit